MRHTKCLQNSTIQWIYPAALKSLWLSSEGKEQKSRARKSRLSTAASITTQCSLQCLHVRIHIVLSGLSSHDMLVEGRLHGEIQRSNSNHPHPLFTCKDLKNISLGWRSRIHSRYCNNIVFCAVKNNTFYFYLSSFYHKFKGLLEYWCCSQPFCRGYIDALWQGSTGKVNI